MVADENSGLRLGGRVHRITCVILFLLLVSAVFVPCHADMYKYQDESGAVCITNSLDSVPKKFRKEMAVVKEDVPKQEKLLDPLPSKVPAQTRQSDPQMSNAQVQQNATPPVVTQDSTQSKYIRTACIVAGMICACFVMGRLTSSLGVPRVGTVLFLAIVLTGGIYLYGMYLQELRSIFTGLRMDALKVKTNVEAREHKTEKMLGEMPEQMKEQQDN